MDLRTDKLALQRLKEAAEKAKIELSSAQTTEINLPFITARMEGGSTTPLHLVETITRSDLEKMVAEPDRAHQGADEEGARRCRPEGRRTSTTSCWSAA